MPLTEQHLIQQVKETKQIWPEVLMTFDWLSDKHHQLMSELCLLVSFLCRPRDVTHYVHHPVVQYVDGAVLRHSEVRKFSEWQTWRNLDNRWARKVIGWFLYLYPVKPEDGWFNNINKHVSCVGLFLIIQKGIALSGNYSFLWKNSLLFV